MKLPGWAFVLSLISAACAAAASIATLAWDGSFPDPSPAPPFNGLLAEARGWSAVTLALALPIFAVALAKARRGSLRGRVAWLGTLAYFTYTYLELAVSGPFTLLYLVYVAAFACALPPLVDGVVTTPLDALAERFTSRRAEISAAVFLLVVSGGLLLAWVKTIVAQMLSGAMGWPGAYGSVAQVVHALDLGLQVPLGIAAGLLLLQRRPGGYLAAAIMLINSVCMAAALTAMVAWSGFAESRSVLGAWPFAVLFAAAAAVVFSFFGAAGEAPLAKHVRAPGAAHAAPAP